MIKINEFRRYFYPSLFLGLLAYQLSFLAWIYPWLDTLGFFLILAATLYLGFKNLRYVAWVVLAELILGSKGYLFAMDLAGQTVSLRMGLWLVLLLVWLTTAFKNKWFHRLAIFKDKYFWPLWLLVAGVVSALVIALINHHQLSKILLDGNAWAFWLLIIPFVFIDWKQDKQRTFGLLAGALSALAIETVFLLYAFSHDLAGVNLAVYGWLRDAGLAEITAMAGGYFRIFLQSQLYLLAGAVMLMVKLLTKLKAREQIKLAVLTGLWLAPLVISLSRSYWVGLAALWLATSVTAIIISRKKMILIQMVWLLSGMLSVIILFAAVNFPIPKPLNAVSADLLKSRVTETEAGAASRWELLPKLWQANLRSPIFGQGFGAEVTYRSLDPRILSKQPDGLYTTYAFEWGWQDIWLKLGLIGLLANLWLIFRLVVVGRREFKTSGDWIAFGLGLSVLGLAAVNIFSPYFNHPLGIGMIIFALVWNKNLAIV